MDILHTSILFTSIPWPIRGTTMELYAGLDVQLESASVCVVDATGRIGCKASVAIGRKCAAILRRLFAASAGTGPRPTSPSRTTGITAAEQRL